MNEEGLVWIYWTSYGVQHKQMAYKRGDDYTDPHTGMLPFNPDNKSNFRWEFA